MSGIGGIIRGSPSGVSVDSLGRMAAAIRHRGPEGYGFYAGQRVGLAHVKLGTLDGDGGPQPLTNEDGQIVLAANCEVFNHHELRRELEERGHIFRTRCHAEVVVHAYEEWGAALLSRLDGQFAFAIYDRNRETVLIARDRFGVRPLFYAQRNGDFFFGSEIKAILATGEVEAALDQRGIDEALRIGAARPPRTTFSGIASMEPGTYGIWQKGAFWLRHYYELDFPETSSEPLDVVEQLDELMLRSVGMRLRADVPIGAYLNGGLDSSITTTLTRSASSSPVQSFSITVDNSACEGSFRQESVGEALGGVHTVSMLGAGTIAQSFPNVLWHTETPVINMAPALMYHLAKLAKESAVKVVIGGEGADELFFGDDVFKEVSVRNFCMRRPESLGRRRLFGRIYPDAAVGNDQWSHLLDCANPGDPLFSHLPRFLGSRIREFYTYEFKAGLGGIDVVGELRASLPTRFFAWSPLNRAAYLEMTTHQSPYLLSSHGDRMTAANGIEGRYPFLDHRVFEFAAALPTGSRLRGLRDKEVLRRWAARILPRGIPAGTKVSYRKPESHSFFLPTSPSWVDDHLTTDALRSVGIFSPTAVHRLVQRIRAGLELSVRETQAMVGILSTQLWHHRFMGTALSVTPLPSSEASVLLGDKVPALSPDPLYDREPC
jgi:asparagine synthase (glutamine-hydrolysing)